MASPCFSAIVRDKTKEMGIIFPAYLLVRTLALAASLGIPLAFGALVDCLSEPYRRGLFTHAVLVFATISLADIALKYASKVLNQRLDASLAFASSQSVIGKLFESDLRSLSKYEPAYLSSRIVADSRSVVTFLLNNLVEGALGIVELACILVLVARLSLSVFSMLCVALPLCAITYAAFRKRISSAAGATKEVAAKYSGANQKQCASAAFVKLNGLFALSSAFVGRFFGETLAGFLGYKRLCASLEASIGAIQLAASLFLFIAGGSLVVQGGLTLGSFTAIDAYLATLVGVTGSLVASGRAAIEANAAARRMDGLLSEPRETRGGAAPDCVTTIEISGLGIGIGNGRNLYGGLNCALRKGEFVCVTGENGSGKTSLLKAVLGAYTDYDGEILVDGKELRKLDLEAFRAGLAAYLPQAPCLFFETADEIMSLGGRVRDAALCESIASRLLARPDPRAFIEARLSGSGGSSAAEASFSGGERQKIAFAVACARRAPLTLLDEPTSAMDAASAAIAGATMKELARDSIVVCVSHDEAVIGMADRVLRL